MIYVTTNIFLSLKCFSMHHIHKYFSFVREIISYLMKYQILKIQMIHTWQKDFLNIKKQAKEAKKYILEICFIFIEFYLFIVLFFVIIICFFTSYFFRCIIILITIRKNDIHLIQIKYCLSYFQFFFDMCLNDVFISKFFAIKTFNFCSIFCMLFEVFWAWNFEWSVNK